MFTTAKYARRAARSAVINEAKRELMAKLVISESTISVLADLTMRIVHPRPVEGEDGPIVYQGKNPGQRVALD